MDIWIVPVLSGQAAAALTTAEDRPGSWMHAGQPRVPVSEMTGRDSSVHCLFHREAAEQRNVYVASTTGMAHRSHLSPDRKWVLVIEMDRGKWLSCL